MAAGLFLASCQPDGPTPKDEQITDPPSSFTKKVMIELFTGEPYNAEDADNEIESILGKYSGKVYSASLHQGDKWEIPQHDLVTQHLGGIAAYPRSAIDRVPAEENSSQTGETIYSRGLWNVNVDLRLQESTNVGLAIQSAVTGNSASCEVFVANNAAIGGNTRLTVYLIENGIKAINQTGITGTYIHNRVLRKVLTAGLGDEIDLSQTGPAIARSFNSFDVSNYNADNLYLIAFINKVGPDAETNEILNVQQVKLGVSKNWN